MEQQQNSQDFPKTACGGIIKDPSRYPSVEYRDEIIYFCNYACLRVFKEDSESFMSGEVEHPTERN